MKLFLFLYLLCTTLPVSIQEKKPSAKKAICTKQQQEKTYQIIPAVLFTQIL